MGLLSTSLAALAALSALTVANPVPRLSRKTPAYKTLPKSSINIVRARVTPDQQHAMASHVSRLAQGESLLYATGVSFLAEITVGDQTFLSILDTGSSDTWFASSDFQCVDYDNSPLPQSACGFGATYTPDSSFTAIADQNFNITYGDQEYLNGYFGTDTVTLADVTVSDQQIALATLAYWVGDGISAGLIGLAYPGLASAYPGNDPSLDDYCSIGETDCNQIQYSTLINTIFFGEQITDPVFTLSLSRDESHADQAGLLTIGGIPDTTDPAVNASGPVATTAIEVLPMDDRFRYYTIGVEGLVYGSVPPGSGQGAAQYIVDSGTTLNYFPTDDTAAFNTLFDPPGYINNTVAGGGYWYVDCQSTFIPALGVQIGGEVFYHNAYDLVLSNGDGTCISGVQDGANTGLYILGDVFMNNVLAIFDVGDSVMGFQSRIFYES